MKEPIFIHVPKTGGHTVKSMFADAEVVIRVDGHVSAYRWQQTPWWTESALRFGFVRNPWDALVSFICYHGNFKENNKQVLTSSKFHSMTQRGLDSAIAYKSTSARFENPVHFDQFGFIADPDGNVILDKVYLLEDISDAVTDLSTRLKTNLSPGHANRSKHDSDYRVYYTDELREKVAELNKELIALFGYRY